MKTKNEVHLTGGIVRINEAKNITSMTIATTVAGVDTAYPTVIFFYPDKTEEFKVGERVTIDGHFQLQVREEDGKRKYKHSIVGDEIIKTQRMLAPFIEDDNISKIAGGIKSDENYAYIFGIVKHIYVAANGVVVLNVSVTDEDGHTNNCEVACFKRQALVAKTLKEEDFVMIAGSVQTRRETSEKTVQNIVCRDILKCGQQS